MIHIRSLWVGLIFSIFWLAPIHPARATGYGYIDLTPPAYESASASAIDGDMIAGSVFVNGAQHAFFWNLDTHSEIDLNPAGSTSFTMGISGDNVVGTVQQDIAAVWNGSATSYTNLNPSGYSGSAAHGIFGNQIVGEGEVGLQSHALLWNESDGTYVDLNPPGVQGSIAVSLNATHQVGLTMWPEHAALWSGSQSYTDLNPAGYVSSQALGISPDDTQIVGNARTSSHEDAYLWDTLNSTGIDLDPGGYFATNAWATNGTIQVGAVAVSSDLTTNHAAVWSGSAATFFDLNSIVPGSESSGAFGVNSAGDIVGTAEIDGQMHAVMWYPLLPEPVVACTGLSLLALDSQEASGISIKKEYREKLAVSYK